MTAVPPDLCQTSIDFLVGRCVAWFGRQGVPGPVWFADQALPFPHVANDETVNVVLFGGFLRRFLQSGSWTAGRMKLWVISEASRQTLHRLMGIPLDAVGLIPRYELVPASAAPHPFPNAGQAFTLVFAGRLSPVKNLEFLLWTAWYLQTEWGLPVQLQMIGAFDNQPHADARRDAVIDYRAKITQLIERLEWSAPPALIPKMDAYEWPKLAFENPLLVNFSTFFSEDFDVSLAQAQAAGWPAWISDWGGHGDARGENLRKVPAHAIGRSCESIPEISRKARSLAARSVASTFTAHAPPVVAARAQATGPRALERHELAKLRGRLIHEIGPQALVLADQGLHAFAESFPGRSFLKRYATVFEGLPLE